MGEEVLVGDRRKETRMRFARHLGRIVKPIDRKKKRDDVVLCRHKINRSEERCIICDKED